MKTKNQFSFYLIFLFLITFLFLILTNSETSLILAQSAISTWWNRILPNLFPFMVLSRCMVETRTATLLGQFISLFLKPVFSLSDDCIYIITVGFLCGFPVGAKTIVDCLNEKRINMEEAKYLMLFCNNIGPLFIISYVFKKCPCFTLPTVLFMLYGIPIIIGILLRYTYFKNKIPIKNTKDKIKKQEELQKPFSDALYQSISGSLITLFQILGCMIIFTVMQLPLYNSAFKIPKKLRILLKAMIEFSSSIELIANEPSLTVLLYVMILPLCGVCCFFQMVSVLHSSKIPYTPYLIGKFLHFIGSMLFLFLF